MDVPFWIITSRRSLLCPLNVLCNFQFFYNFICTPLVPWLLGGMQIFVKTSWSLLRSSFGHDQQHEGKDPGQGGYPTWPTVLDLCQQVTQRHMYTLRIKESTLHLVLHLHGDIQIFMKMLTSKWPLSRLSHPTPLTTLKQRFRTGKASYLSNSILSSPASSLQWLTLSCIFTNISKVNICKYSIFSI